MPEHYLAWFLQEARNLLISPLAGDTIAFTCEYARIILSYAGRLAALGVQPVSLPVQDTCPNEVPMAMKQKDGEIVGTVPLTIREQEILVLIHKGQKNREIAETLRLTESTVHKHIQNIFGKLKARNRAEALYNWAQGGWFPLSGVSPVFFSPSTNEKEVVSSKTTSPCFLPSDETEEQRHCFTQEEHDVEDRTRRGG